MDNLEVARGIGHSIRRWLRGSPIAKWAIRVDVNRTSRSVVKQLGDTPAIPA
jgi:hypothetical protein